MSRINLPPLRGASSFSQIRGQRPSRQADMDLLRSPTLLDVPETESKNKPEKKYSWNRECDLMKNLFKTESYKEETGCGLRGTPELPNINTRKYLKKPKTTEEFQWSKALTAPSLRQQILSVCVPKNTEEENTKYLRNKQETSLAPTSKVLKMEKDDDEANDYLRSKCAAKRFSYFQSEEQEPTRSRFLKKETREEKKDLDSEESGLQRNLLLDHDRRFNTATTNPEIRSESLGFNSPTPSLICDKRLNEKQEDNSKRFLKKKVAREEKDLHSLDESSLTVLEDEEESGHGNNEHFNNRHLRNEQKTSLAPNSKDLKMEKDDDEEKAYQRTLCAARRFSYFQSEEQEPTRSRFLKKAKKEEKKDSEVSGLLSNIHLACDPEEDYKFDSPTPSSICDNKLIEKQDDNSKHFLKQKVAREEEKDLHSLWMEKDDDEEKAYQRVLCAARRFSYFQSEEQEPTRSRFLKKAKKEEKKDSEESGLLSNIHLACDPEEDYKFDSPTPSSICDNKLIEKQDNNSKHFLKQKVAREEEKDLYSLDESSLTVLEDVEESGHGNNKHFNIRDLRHEQKTSLEPNSKDLKMEKDDDEEKAYQRTLCAARRFSYFQSEEQEPTRSRFLKKAKKEEKKDSEESGLLSNIHLACDPEEDYKFDSPTPSSICDNKLIEKQDDNSKHFLKQKVAREEEKDLYSLDESSLTVLEDEEESGHWNNVHLDIGELGCDPLEGDNNSEAIDTYFSSPTPSTYDENVEEDMGINENEIVKIKDHSLCSADELLAENEEILLAEKEEVRLKKQAKRDLKQLRETLKAEQERRQLKLIKENDAALEDISEKEKRLKEEYEDRLKRLRRSLLAQRKEEEEKLRRESEEKLHDLRETIKADRLRQEEKIRQEERRLKAENEQRLENLRKTLLAKGREEEDAFRKDSDKMVAEVFQKDKRQEEKLRKEHDATLEDLKEKLQQQQEEDVKKLKARNKRKLEELKEERKALAAAKYAQHVNQYRKEMMDNFKEVRQDLEREQERSLEVLKEDHQREVSDIRRKHMDEVARLKEQLRSDFAREKEQMQASHALDLEKLSLQHQAEIHKRQEENARKESQLQLELDLRHTDLQSKDAMLWDRVQELNKRRKGLESDESIAERKRLNREVDMLKEHLERERKETLELSEKISALERKKGTTEDAHFREELAMSKEECNRVRDELRESREECDKTRDELRKSREECDKIREELTKSRDKYDRARLELESSRDEWRVQLTKSIEDRNQLQELCDRLLVKVQQLEESSDLRQPNVIEAPGPIGDTCYHVEDQRPLAPEVGSNSIPSFADSTHRTKVCLDQERQKLEHRLQTSTDNLYSSRWTDSYPAPRVCNRSTSSSAYSQGTSSFRPSAPLYGQRIQDYLSANNSVSLPNRSGPFNNRGVIKLGLDPSNNIRLYY
ncbi:hypothetical protein WMY93_017043 [Mugilogobius chulae]|uniref:Trichohyalin n=1 Tax=Mugilogobius chulae TaxID=88201 RepID=A0AAW0NYP8_9GOBI